MKHKIYHVVGLMSGTSLDGVDLAYLTFQKEKDWKYSIREVESEAYSSEWKAKLQTAHSLSLKKIAALDVEYTDFLVGRIERFLLKNNIEHLDAVCSHGHTVLHQPEKGFTLQIGNLPVLAEKLQQCVVCDFRVQDVAYGGQGAPLVPIGDELLFPEYDYCLNLGGFANISTVMKGKRIAYDICPVNTVLNFYAEKLGVPFDEGGKIALSGKPNSALLAQLNQFSFYRENPPKSLGIEWVNAFVFPLLKKCSLSEKDILATYTEHIAQQIAHNLGEAVDKKCLCTGGGTYNRFLMQRIQAHTSTQLIVPSEDLIDYKEALIFGFLGVLKLRGEINVLSSVTGATKDHSSGVILN